MAGGSSNSTTSGSKTNEEKTQASNTTITIKTLNLTGNQISSYSMVKLNHENSLLRKNMVLPIIRKNKIEEFITEVKICPPKFTEEMMNEQV